MGRRYRGQQHPGPVEEIVALAPAISSSLASRVLTSLLTHLSLRCKPSNEKRHQGLVRLRSPISCACNSLINFKLSGSASIVELCLLLLPRSAPGDTAGPSIPSIDIVLPLLSVNALPRRAEPDSGVKRCCAIFAGRDECLEERPVVGGVMALALTVVGGVSSVAA